MRMLVQPGPSLQNHRVKLSRRPVANAAPQLGDADDRAKGHVLNKNSIVVGREEFLRFTGVDQDGAAIVDRPASILDALLAP